MHNNNLRALSFSNLTLVEGSVHLDYFIGNHFSELCIDGINININLSHLHDIITPKLEHLSLSGTNIDDFFIEQLSILKFQNLLNITTFDISCTKITSKCFEFLNVLKLKRLWIGACYEIVKLTALDVSFLESLDLSYMDLDDNDIECILKIKSSLSDLYLLRCKNITDVTLRNIHERKITLSDLDLSLTQVTTNGIIKYLSNMGLRRLFVSNDVYDRNKFRASNVIRY